MTYLSRIRTALTYGAKRLGRNLTFAGAAALVLTGVARAETVTVVALGDSLTQGYGLPQAEGFVPQLQGWLEAQGIDAEVINAGVSGDTTAGGLARVGWSLTPEVDAMIVALGGNDFLRGLPPEASRANLDSILAEAAARELPVLLVGMKATSNYGPDYKADFDAMYPELAAGYDTLYYESFFAGLTETEEDLGAARAQYMQSDGIHPNAEGVEKIVAHMGPVVADLVAQAGAKSP
jgi:acyl-CoA thioesterase-1